MDKCKRNSGLHSPALPPPPPSSQRKGPPGLVWRPSRLNTRDREIVEALSFRVRVFSVEQITSHWFGDGGGAAAAADRRLRLLERAGMVERFPMLARPVIPLDAPVVAWEPEGTPPSFTELSTYLARRWSEPVRKTAFIIATERAATWCGGLAGRRPRKSEASHDQTLAALYLQFLAADQTLAETWRSEAVLQRDGFGKVAKLPDAMVEKGGRKVAIELGGVYSAVKLREFHQFCEKKGLPYELW